MLSCLAFEERANGGKTENAVRDSGEIIQAGMENCNVPSTVDEINAWMIAAVRLWLCPLAFEMDQGSAAHTFSAFKSPGQNELPVLQRLS